MVRLRSGEGQTGANIIALEIRKIGKHFCLAHTSGEEIEDVLRLWCACLGCKDDRRIGVD